MSQDAAKSLIVDGTQANGFAVKLDQLIGLYNFGENKDPALRQLMLKLAVPITNATGGGTSKTVTKQRLANLLKVMLLHTPEHDFVDCKYSGGIALVTRYYKQTGRYPHWFVDTAIADTVTTTFYLTFPISWFDKRQGPGKAEDKIASVQIFRDSRLEFTVAQTGTGELGGAVSVGAITASVYHEVVPRDEFRIPTKWKLEEIMPGAMTTQLDKLGGSFVRDLDIVPVMAAGAITAPAFATTDFTDLTLTFDGVNALNKVPPAIQVDRFNERHAASTSDYLPSFEGGTCWFIPLVGLSPTSGKTTKIGLAKNPPAIDFGGALSTPQSNLRLVADKILAGGPAYANQLKNRLKLAIDVATMVGPKGDTELVTDPLKAAVLPQVVYQGGKPH